MQRGLFVAIAVLHISLLLGGCTLPPSPQADSASIPVPTSQIQTRITYTLAQAAVTPSLSAAYGLSSLSSHDLSRIAATSHFEFWRDGDISIPVTTAQLQVESERILDYVVQRLEVSPPADLTVSVVFRPRPEVLCAPRGTATLHPQPKISLFLEIETSPAYVWGVLAHEVGHIVHWHSLPGSESLLDEGIATWMAGKYYLTWQGGTDFHAQVRSFAERGMYIPPFEYEPARASPDKCVQERDIVYTELASFVDFLVTRYGIGQLHLLLETTPGPRIEDNTVVIELPRYEEVYGKGLSELEYEWLRFVFSPSATRERNGKIRTTQDH